MGVERDETDRMAGMGHGAPKRITWNDRGSYSRRSVLVLLILRQAPYMLTTKAVYDQLCSLQNGGSAVVLSCGSTGYHRFWSEGLKRPVMSWERGDKAVKCPMWVRINLTRGAKR